MAAEVCLGIDFGSLYITSYVVMGDQKCVVSDEHGNRFIPAAIYIDENETVVGASVSQLARSHPNNIINHPLHYLDSRKCNPDCNDSVKVEIDKEFPVFLLPAGEAEKKVSLETVFEECFKRVLELSVLTFHKKPAHSVIAVSSSMCEKNRLFLLACAKKAKLPHPAIIDSHLAALLEYEESSSFPSVTDSPVPTDIEKDRNGEVMILDLPSSTASISFITAKDGYYELTDKHSLACSIGNAVDNVLYEYLLQDACKKVGPDLRYSKKAISKLRREVTLCKETLSKSMTTNIMIESLFDGLDYSITISRARFDMLTHPIIEQLMAEIKQYLTIKQITLSSFHCVYLIGGSASIPSIREALQAAFASLHIPNHGTESVAVGAAIHASMRRNYKGKGVLPTLQRSTYEITMTIGEITFVVLEKGRILPCKQSFECSIAATESDLHAIHFNAQREGKEEKHLGIIKVDEDLREKNVMVDCILKDECIKVVLDVYDDGEKRSTHSFTIRNKN